MINNILDIIFTKTPHHLQPSPPKTIQRSTTQNVFLIGKYCHTIFKRENPLPEWATAVKHRTSNSCIATPWVISTLLDGKGSQPSLTIQVNRIL